MHFVDLELEARAEEHIAHATGVTVAIAQVFLDKQSLQRYRRALSGGAGGGPIDSNPMISTLRERVAAITAAGQEPQ